MKCLLALSLSAGLLAVTAMAQPSDTYINYGQAQVPPLSPSSLQIDAVNFINEGPFVWVNTNFTMNAQLWEPSNTRNFINNNTMVGMPGLRFDCAPSSSGVRTPAESFQNNGSITVDSDNATFFGFNRFLFQGGVPQLKVLANNIASPGTISLGLDTVATFTGGNVDFSGGHITMATTGTNVFANTFFFNQGYFDGYWGLDTNSNPAGFFNSNPPMTPSHLVTNRTYLRSFEQLVGNNSLTYYDEFFDNTGSNRFVRAVVVINTNTDVSLNVVFPPAQFSPFWDIIVEWQMVAKNQLSTSTNYMYLADSFGGTTNFGLFWNGFTSAFATYIPQNYDFLIGGPFNFGQKASPQILPRNLLNSNGSAAQYAAYQAIFNSSAQILADVVGQDVTNESSRIEINATKYLDLTDSTIASASYLKIQATNHFAGSTGASISSPWCDLNLRITNGTFTVTNLLKPTVTKPEGTVELFSSRWTNNAAGLTNSYHVLFVQSRITTESPSRIQDLTLRVTNSLGGADNLIINDTLNITRNLLLDASRITVATNDSEAVLPAGALNCLSSSVIWPTVTPRLQYFTNQGTVTSVSTMLFGGQRSSPYYTSNFTQPYWQFINYGGITNSATLISATNVLSIGNVLARNGNVELRDNLSAILTNGGFYAPLGSIKFESGSLVASNQALIAGVALSFTITNLLDDGSLAGSVETITNKNLWTAGGGGLSLNRLPVRASLLGTTISDKTVVTGQRVPIKWAGKDLGATSAGFSANAGVGKLILDGTTNSIFQFTAPAAGAAIYIDSLELRNWTAENRDASGNFKGLSADANIKIYYGQAIANGVSIAEKLDGKNGGRFVWVSTYNTGFYSSTNVVYPDGSTNKLNTALVTSCALDTDQDGILNCQDSSPVPVLSPKGLNLAVNYAAQPSPKALVSWTTVPYSINYLLTSLSATGTNWTVVTNFIQGANGGRVIVADPIQPKAAPRYYRVRVDGP